VREIAGAVGTTFALRERCTPEEEQSGALQTVFEDGQLTNFQTLGQIRARLWGKDF
jgi:hypothetical protein